MGEAELVGLTSPDFEPNWERAVLSQSLYAFHSFSLNITLNQNLQGCNYLHTRTYARALTYKILMCSQVRTMEGH